MKNRKYYKYLDFIRLISCIAVFLYHLNMLKGGYLAVCIFFVLTGYLSFTSSFNKENFSIKNYYLSRLKSIYLPFIIVVFISVFTITLIPSINWINLKPETTSTILGYNNFWQLSASLDYFARHVDSPFMHFWYISILLQFELVFPLLFIGFKKISESCGVRIPATTSSPCALTRYSPLNRFSPLAASRLKQTPVADVSPMLPNTIAITLTAVPHSSGMPSILR